MQIIKLAYMYGRTLSKNVFPNAISKDVKILDVSEKDVFL